MFTFKKGIIIIGHKYETFFFSSYSYFFKAINKINVNNKKKEY